MDEKGSVYFWIFLCKWKKQNDVGIIKCAIVSMRARVKVRVKDRRDLKIKKIPVPKGDSHIEPPNGMGLMPIHEFTMGLIAPKGQGKTTTIVNLLEIYSKYL